MTAAAHGTLRRPWPSPSKKLPGKRIYIPSPEKQKPKLPRMTGPPPPPSWNTSTHTKSGLPISLPQSASTVGSVMQATPQNEEPEMNPYDVEWDEDFEPYLSDLDKSLNDTHLHDPIPTTYEDGAIAAESPPRPASISLPVSHAVENEISCVETQLQELAIPSEGPRIEPNDELLIPPPTYSIPDDVLQDAINSQGTEKKKMWSYRLYRSSEGKPVTRLYCKTLEQSERVAKLFQDEVLLGFDIEWLVPRRGNKSTTSRSPKSNVSVIQIASESKVAIFHLALHKGEKPENLVAPTLKRILESDKVLKCGVNILGDSTRMRTNLDVECRGLFELSHLHKLVEHASTEPQLVNRKAVRLDKLVYDHLQLPLDKDPDVRSGNWTLPLNDRQAEYACSDAYAGVMVFQALEAKRQALTPVPPRPYHCELGMSIRTSNEISVGQDMNTAGLRDVEVSRRKATKNAPMTSVKKQRPQQDEPSDGSSESEDAFEPMPAKQAESRSWQSNDPAAATQLLLSDQWAQNFRNNVQDEKTTALTATQLMAYALWHQHALPVSGIAQLRQPSIKPMTVAAYILDCIKGERLPFDETRIDDVFRIVGDHAVQYRYSSVLKRLTISRSNDL